MFARCFDGAVRRQISFWGRIRHTCCQPGLKTEARLEKVRADVCDSVWKKWQESIFRSFVNVWLLQKVTSEDWGHECYLSWSLFVSASPSTAKRQILWWSHETCTLTSPDLREKKRRSHVFIWIRLPNDQFVRFNESFLYWTKNEVLHQTPTALHRVQKPLEGEVAFFMSPNLSESTPLDLDRKPPAWYSVITAHRTILRQRSPPAAWPGWLPWPRPWARWCALQMLLRCSRWTSSLNPGRRKPGLAWKRVGGNQNIFGPRSDHCLALSFSQSPSQSACCNLNDVTLDVKDA